MVRNYPVMSFHMTQTPLYLFANVRYPCEGRPNMTAIVLFGLTVQGEDSPVYMEIRFIDYLARQIDGDHLMFSLDHALMSARNDYGILETDWRAMSTEEIDRIDW
ncbi:hypothetical protein TU85_19005 [Pseudomonas helleri]|nr:hypothetical protein TU85_19005 [Pseudomonas helleri]